MSENISPPELLLLEYLRQHSSGTGQRISLDPSAIARGLRIGADQLARDSALLATHGLAGVRSCRPNAHDVPSSRCSAIWITKKGEDYLRRR